MDSIEEKLRRDNIISAGLIRKFFIGDYKSNGTTFTFEFGGEKYKFEQDELYERLSKILNSIVKHYMPNILEERYNENNKYPTKKHEYSYIVSSESNSKETTDFMYSIPVIYLAKSIKNIASYGSDKTKGKFFKSCVMLWNEILKPKLEEKDYYEIIFHTLDETVDQVSIAVEGMGELAKKKQDAARKTFTPNFLDKTIILGYFITREEFEKRKFEFMMYIIMDEKLVKQLFKEGFIRQEDITETLSQEILSSYVSVLGDKCKYLTKFLDTEHLFGLCKTGKVSVKELARRPIHEVFKSAENEFAPDEMAAFIMDIKQYYNPDAIQNIIWQLYEKNYFSDRYMSFFNAKNVVREEKVVRVYLRNQERKIAAEVNETSVSLSKLSEFLDPYRIIKIVESNSAGKEEKQFVTGELKSYCKGKGNDFDGEIMSYVKDQEKKGAKASRMALYSSGLVDLKYFDDGDISEAELLKRYEETLDNRTVVDGYNCGIIEGTTIYEIIDMDNNALCQMVHNDGLNPSILTDLFSTYEVLELCAKGVGDLTISDLNGINFNIDEIMKLYGEMKLPLVLLNDLQEANALTEEQVKKIRKSYDVNNDFDKLVAQGVVYGLDDIQRARELDPIDFDVIIDDTNIRNPHKVVKKDRMPDRIGFDLRLEIINHLGADSRVLPVDGELFEDYDMYALLDKDIAIIEPMGGRAYTFVMPLRMVLDQVFGKGILETTKYKKELVYNPSIRAIRHTARYGRSLVEAVCDLCEEYGEQKPLRKDKELKGIVSQIADTYKSFAKDLNIDEVDIRD